MNKAMAHTKKKNFVSKNKPEQTPDEKAHGFTAPVRPDLTIGMKIGALMYYDDPKVVTRQAEGKPDWQESLSFEDIDPAEKEIWYQRGDLCVKAVGKLGLMLAPYQDPKETQDRFNRNVDILTGIIQGFHKRIIAGRKGKKELNLEIYPAVELAHLILKVN